MSALNRLNSVLIAPQVSPLIAHSFLTFSIGKYCESHALTGVQSDCDAGYYCKSGSTMRSPLDSLTGALDIGDICPEGSYCSAGVEEGILCSPGFYCPDEFMTALNAANVCQ